MALLPRSNTEFADPNYWRSFFEKRQTPFEWYGDFNQIGSSLERYLKPQDAIIQIGCGNSLLAEQLYDNGYRRVTSIDTDQGVIDKQRSRNANNRPELLFERADASRLTYEAGTFSAVLDKGTLDALFPPDADDATRSTVKSMFSEVQRVLSPGGRYIVVTLAQEHILQEWLSYFSETHEFILRIHKCAKCDDGFVMPVFLLVATRLKAPMPGQPILELSLADAANKAKRMSSVDELVENVRAAQEYNWFCHMCSEKLSSEASITINGPDGRPRYLISICDDPELKSVYLYAMFIVPVGREAEWLFCTAKGRQILRKTCNRHRLAVVRLYRNQEYESLDLIKDELNSIALDLAPGKSKGQKIEFLSLGEVDVKKTLAGGKSAVNGDWTVENVQVRTNLYRRLVFLSSQNLVQSEALLKKVKGKHVVDLDTLTCDHHEAMLSALGLLGDRFAADAPLRLAVVGLGGGSLASFLHRKLPRASVVGVELDPEVVTIAAKWFDCPVDDSRMTVVVGDGVKFLADAVKGDLFDVVFVDVAGAMHDDGLSCPPAVFITDECLRHMRDSLTPTGCLALNLVTRDEEISASVRSKLAQVFPMVLRHSSEQEVNEVLLCPKWSIESNEPRKRAKSLPSGDKWLKTMGDNLNNLRIC